MYNQNPIVPLLFALFAYPMCLPILLAIYILNLIWRTGLSVYAWWTYQGLVSLVDNGRDGIWTYCTGSRTSICLIACVLDKTVLDERQLAFLFEKHVLLFEEPVPVKPTLFFGLPTFPGQTYRPYQKFEKIYTVYNGYAAWKFDEKFHVTRHFRSVPEPKKVYSQDEILEILSDLSISMDESKPQWELLLVPRYKDPGTSEERSMIIMRFHHAYMDGMSILQMLAKTGLCSNVKPKVDPQKFKLELWQMAIFYINSILYSPYHLLTMLVFNQRKCFWHVRKDEKEPAKRHYSSSGPIPSKVFRKIRENTDATIPSLTALAFATAVKKTLGKDRTVPVVRWTEIIAMLPYPNSDPQNRFTVFSYDVDTAFKADTAAAFNDTVATIRRNRLGGLSGPEPLLSYYALGFIGKLPTFVLPYLMEGLSASAILSNVPTFKENIKLFGHTVRDFSPWPPIANDTGIVFASISYSDSVVISATAHSSWLSKAELEDIVKEMTNVINGIESNGKILPDVE